VFDIGGIRLLSIHAFHERTMLMASAEASNLALGPISLGEARTGHSVDAMLARERGRLWAGEIDAAGIVPDAIKDGLGVGRILGLRRLRWGAH
jgi:hypothetical protein